jgi:hypothetical protein
MVRPARAWVLAFTLAVHKLWPSSATIASVSSASRAALSNLASITSCCTGGEFTGKMILTSLPSSSEITTCTFIRGRPCCCANAASSKSDGRTPTIKLRPTNPSRPRRAASTSLGTGSL